MARDFDGSTDRLSGTVDYTYPTMVSFFARVFPDTTGGGGFGRVIQAVDGSNNTIFNVIIRDDVGGNALSFTRGWDGGNGEWHTSTFSLGAWRHFMATYDGGATTNDPVLYLDGATTGVTELTTPAGALRTSVTDTYVGNRSANDRGWDGRIADMGLWNRILTFHEYLLVLMGGPLAVPFGLIRFWPIWGTVSPDPDWLGAEPLTVTSGTTRIDHPHSISAQWESPHPRRVQRTVAGVGAPFGTLQILRTWV